MAYYTVLLAPVNDTSPYYLEHSLVTRPSGLATSAFPAPLACSMQVQPRLISFSVLYSNALSARRNGGLHVLDAYLSRPRRDAPGHKQLSAYKRALLGFLLLLRDVGAWLDTLDPAHFS